MPLVVTALDAALDLPAPGAGGAEPPPTVLGRALKRVGAVADADARNVSRAQIEVRLVSDHLGAGCRVTAVGENPTPWFPSGREGLAGSEDGTSEPSKRLLRKGESAVLRDGDGLGLCQTDAPPGALRFQSARAARTLGPEALFDVDTRNTKLAFTPPGRSTGRATPFTDGAGRDADADAIDSRDEKNENDDSKVSDALFVEKSARGAKRARDVDEDRPMTTDHATVIEPLTLPLKYGFRRPIVLVLSGAPGSGKSTFCASLPNDTWTVVNQDTAGKNGKPGTRAKCVQLVRGALNKQRNVAVDRCGLTSEQRQDFVRLARERGAEAHALWLDLPRELLFERLRHRTNHPTVKDGAGVAVCKRMLGAKANAPPGKKEGFVRVTRCANEWDVERALAGYRRITNVASDGGGVGDEKSVGDAESPKADGADGAAATPAKPSDASPNAFAVMMGAAKASAKTPPGSAKKEKHTNASASASNPEKGGGSWRDALSAMAADPHSHFKRGAVLFFDDELVVAKDAYPKSRTHLLVLARDTRLAEGPKALRSSDASLVRRMMRAGLECARRLVGNSSDRAEDDFENQFRCGFHASPSMRTAHMHVVSLDLRGSGMKTRRHWNSFATSFFKEAEETAIFLEKGNERLDWDVAELERVVAMTPLRCHKCGDGPFNTMPKLFAHCDACESEGFSVRTDSSL
jgi:aprataxin